MKNLWTVLPPLLSDNFGFAEVIRNSDGCGVIDDSGDFRIGGGHGDRDGHEKRSGNRRHGENKAHHGGHGNNHNGRGRKGGKGTARVEVSGADSQDVTSGTREKLLQAFQSANDKYAPSFALFSAGPCGAMIGTDLAEIADTVAKEYHIPTAAVDLSGQKTYDVGLSRTTAVLAKLLAEDGEILPGTVNILGASALDWADEDVANIRLWAERQGYQVLAQPGGTVTADQLRRMGKAQLNLVVSVSGLAAAKHLQEKFGTPYIAASPFGIQKEMPKKPQEAMSDVLIIGEQFCANAVREALEGKHMAGSVDMATFFQLEKSLARSADKRLKGEDGARQLLNNPQYRVVIADPLLRPLLQRDCKWIDLPHRAMNTYSEVKGISLLGDHLDHWLDRQF